jgi:predicted ATPase/class 3 adenylate cyclase
MRTLPRGVVTFLFSDIEASTALWEDDPDAMRVALAAHDEMVGRIVRGSGGEIVKHTGDGFLAAFESASGALIAARDLEVELPSIASGRIRVRIGIHTGEEAPRDGDYFGPNVNEAARIMDAANGGQILLSAATFEVVGGDAPDDTSFVEAGRHRLKDLRQPVRLYHLVRTASTDRRPLRTLDALPNNLPVQLTSFVGRDTEVKQIASLVGDGRLVTLTGFAGVGKTRLALQVGADLSRRFPGGVWFLELAKIAQPELVPRAVAEALGVRVLPQQLASEAVFDRLAQLQALLILDNCEHVIDAVAEFVDRVLRRAPHVKVLATSRESLGVAGERIWLVGPLRVDGDEAAVELFEDRARLVDPDFAVTEANRHLVVEMCVRLDGIPLAIELATARLKMLDLDQIAERMSDRFMLLTGGTRTAEGRQRTLQATMDWSYQLLAESEQAVLRRLGVFAAGFTLEAAEVVVADDSIPTHTVLDVLGRLVDTSLVMFDNDVARYELLETVRAYATDKLDTASETGDAHRRHAGYFGEWVSDNRDQIGVRSSYGDPPVEDVRREMPNLRSAMTWAYQAGEQPIGLRIALGIYPYLLATDALREALHWLLPGIEGVEVPQSIEEAQGLAAAQSAAFYIADEGRCAELADRIRLAVDRVTEPGQRAELHYALGNHLSSTSTEAGDAEYRTAIALFRQVASPRWDQPLNGRLRLIYQSGDDTNADEVRELFDEAVAAGLESPLYLATVRAEIAVVQDRPEEAVGLLDPVELDDLSPGLRRIFRYGLASALLAVGRLDEAESMLARIAEAQRELGNQALRITVWPSWWSGLIALQRGDVDAAVSRWDDFRYFAGQPGNTGPSVLMAGTHALLADHRSDRTRVAELCGYYTHGSGSTGWRLRPAHRRQLRAAADRARADIGEAEFDRQAAHGAASDYTDLPLYDA